MAAGTITYPYKRGKDVWGHSAVVPFQYAGPVSYLAGGDAAFAAGKIKLGVIEWMLGGWGIAANGLTAVRYEYNTVTGAIQAFWSKTTPAGAFPEVTDATDLSGYVALLVAFGRG